MSDFNRFREQLTRTDSSEPITDAEAWRIYRRVHAIPDQQPYVRHSSGKTPEEIARLKRKFRSKMKWRALRERIAKFIFRF